MEKVLIINNPKKKELNEVSEKMYEALKLADSFLCSLPEGWLGKTTGDVGALNDFYIKLRKINALLN